jgi:hypothetical protein
VIPTSDKALYVAHGLALFNEIRTWLWCEMLVIGGFRDVEKSGSSTGQSHLNHKMVRGGSGKPDYRSPHYNFFNSDSTSLIEYAIPMPTLAVLLIFLVILCI